MKRISAASGENERGKACRLTPLAWRMVCLSILWGGSASAAYYFNPAMLRIGNAPKTEVDLSLFADGKKQSPGNYRVKVFMNETPLDSRMVTFVLRPDHQGQEHLQPCLSTADLAALGVNIDAIPALKEAQNCVDLPQAIADANAEFVFSQQQLKISIPQAALKRRARGYVSSERWDHGVPSILVNYSFSGAQSRVRHGGGNDDNYFLSLRNGANLREWRLRNSSLWSRDSRGRSQWHTVNTYLQRDIVPLKGQLTLGDATTTGEMFDSLAFRGLQLASVEEMYPDSLRGYSPVVRGIARSNAKVTIRQSDQVIDQRFVPPGAFEISDLYAVSGSGDLDVIITESDGTEQHLIVPFASLPVLQREGRLSYGFTMGQYRPGEAHIDSRYFLQSTLIYGLPWGTTVYGGSQLAERYQSLLIGAGKNMGNGGALSLDSTQSWARLRQHGEDGGHHQGQMWRLRYGKSFAVTGTQLTLAGYRYATGGFSTLQRALAARESASERFFSSNGAQTRSRKEFSIQQGIGLLSGSLYLNFIEEDFWNHSDKRRSFVVGYNGAIKGISYGLNYNQNRSGRAGSDRVIALNLSIPLNIWSHPTWANYSVNNNNRGQTSQNLGFNGTALADNNLNWGLNQGYTNQGKGESTNLNLAYSGVRARAETRISRDRYQQRLSYGLQGGVLLHADGLTLSQPLNDTVVLVKAPGAGDVRIINQVGVRTDGRGYTVVPYANPYRENNIALDPATLADDVELELTSQTVVPTQGAVVVAHYKTRVGGRLMMILTRPEGGAVPFGALATLTESQDVNSSIVGDGGQVYLTGMPATGVLHVQWGAGPDQQCRASYNLPPSSADTGLPLLEAQCL